MREVNAEAATRLAERIEAELRASYGKARKPRLDPLDELILTILSQNTSDVNRDRAWAKPKCRLTPAQTGSNGSIEAQITHTF